MNNMNEKINNILGSLFFATSIGLVLYRISKYKKKEDHNVNYYMISDMNVNPSPYLRRLENCATSIESLCINNVAVRDLIVREPSNIRNKDSSRQKMLSDDNIQPSSSILSRKKDKYSPPRPTIYAPNPVRNKENIILIADTSTSTPTPTSTSTSTSTTANSPNTNSTPLRPPYDSSIISSPSYFYDITSPTSIDNDNSIESNHSESFDTPQTGPISIHEENKISNCNVVTDNNNNETFWISPIFADVIKWEISNSGIIFYVLECRTTRGPVLEWSCNKTLKQFQELKKQLNSMLDLDLDQNNLLSASEFNNYDTDTALWQICSIISNFMMNIMKREEIMKKSSTFHLITDFLDPDN